MKKTIAINQQLRSVSLCMLGLVAASCGSSSNSPVLPDVSKASFVSGVDNPYFPLKSGAKWVFESTTTDGTEHIEVSVPGTTKTIQGITATVVRDTATLNGKLIEDTTDWFAQDSDGNVWYLGEDTCVYENEVCVDKEGSWTYGVDGALPGIAMPATPKVDNQPYRQEYFVGHAEDVGEVVALNQTAKTPAGSFTDCIQTHDTSTKDLKLDELKTYCKGFGLVLTKEGSVNEELIEYNGL